MSARSNQPLVSCIMPTYNRRAFVPHAIEYFLRQTYPHRELIVLDDGTDTVDDLLPQDPRIHYYRLDIRLTVGAKRNMGGAKAAGELMLHWDDDDWMADWRIGYQVEELLSNGADIVGLDRLYFWDPAGGRAWNYVYPPKDRPWVAGGTLCYSRAFWQTNPFPEVNIGEDAGFVWSSRTKRLLALPDPTFYVALVHPGNTSPKITADPRWQPCSLEEIQAVTGSDFSAHLPSHRVLPLRACRLPPSAAIPLAEAIPLADVTTSATEALVIDGGPPESAEGSIEEDSVRHNNPTYGILMVVHNARPMVQISTLCTLEHTRGEDAELVVVDNDSSDGVAIWLDLLARRGDIRLVRQPRNIGHGPALELARRETAAPYLVALDSDAFPLCDDWLFRLRSLIDGGARAAGICHHRDYIHPSCLMVARKTLDDWGLSFLDEKDRSTGLDVAERISVEIRQRGERIAGLHRTGALRRGSASEPVYLGSEYEGLVYHQWYTTRSATAPGQPVDDVSLEALDDSLAEVILQHQSRPREVAVIVGVRAGPEEIERRRNVEACLRGLNLQDLERWRYRIVVVEQDRAPQLQAQLGPLADRYLFAANPGLYNRGWAFNVGSVHAAASDTLLCLMDADLLPDPGFLRRGLEAMQERRGALLPYTEVLYLDATSTLRVIQHRFEKAGLRSNDLQLRGRSFTTSQGGCIWVTADHYREVGGHDERFRGWGFEDREFADRLARIAPVERLPGRLIHLNHPASADPPEFAEANGRLYEVAAAHRSPSSARSIGCLDLYRTAPAPEETAGYRSWEHWHRWGDARIERIVLDEMQRLPESSNRRHLAEVLAPLGSSLLDVGCGPGALWHSLAPYRSCLRWVGADITLPMLQVAHRLFPEVPLCRADASRLPFADDSFDVVLLRHLLEHLPEPLMEEALASAARVARQAVVIDFYCPPLRHGARRTSPVGEGFLETYWVVADLQKPIENAGWRISRELRLEAVSGEVDEVWILAPAGNRCGHGRWDAAASGAALPEARNSSAPKISIIMPTYRRAHTLYDTVATVQAQTYTHWELIIVDNAGDGGYRFDDPRIRVYSHPERTSASYARNQGLEYATGDLVCFFDDDDEMFAEYLEQFVVAFGAHPHANMVRCGMLVTGDRPNFTYATPECCLRRSFARPLWSNRSLAHDQDYFQSLIHSFGWKEGQEVVVLNKVLCRARSDAQGGLRSGKL